jgi:hypothetical protein
VGQDVDGFCGILSEAGHAVSTSGIPLPAPRIGDLHPDAAAEVLGLYCQLGGRRGTSDLRPGPWDVLVDGLLVELDEQLHFNRYRAATLAAASCQRLPRFPVAAYTRFCPTKEADCLKPGRAQGRWMNASTESHFGPSGPRGDLSGAGSSRWKQRAIYDAMKDLTQLDQSAPRLARVAIWDPLPGVPDVLVEDAVHRAPNQLNSDRLRALLAERSGRPL